MNCLEFRRRVGAEPNATDAELAAHQAACATCAAYRERMVAMDALLARAMRISLQPAAAPQGRQARVRNRLAMAASLVAGILVATMLWVTYPAQTLAGEVMNHVTHEPEAWLAKEPLAAGAVRAVLDPSGVRLREDAGTVTYARRCLYAGRWVPHLVIQTAAGPVTVLLLLHRDVDARVAVEEQEMAGVVLPAPRGSMAIVGRDVTGLEEIAGQVLDAVEWDT